MKHKKKLNLNKYAFLNFLKGDIFTWLTCNENYQRASEESRYLEKLTPWRFDNKDKDQSEDKEMRKDIPDQIITGISIGEFATEWAKASYPNHKVITIDKYTNLENIEYTKQFLKSNENYIIFEATFGYNEFHIRTDILIKTEDSVKIIEVKAVTVPLEIHAWDIFFQKTIIEKNNPKWQWNYSLLIIDSLYIHDTNLTPPQKALNLFVETPLFLTSKSKPGKKNGVKWSIKHQLLYAGFGFGDLPEDANISKTKWLLLSDFFNDYSKLQIVEKFDGVLARIKEIQLMKNPPISGLEERNWSFLKSDYMPWVLKLNGADIEDSLFDIRNLKISKKLKLFNEMKLNTIQDVPLSMIVPKNMAIDSQDDKNTQKYIDKFLSADPGSLKYKTLIQKHFVKKKHPMVHIQGIKNELTKYEDGPIYMYDFETVNLANPLVKWTSPYQQVPYQFSIHIITNPYDFNIKPMKNVEHIEWLAKDKKNFHQEFWLAFAKVFEKYGKGVYVSWNMSFEKTVINNMDTTLLNSEQVSIIKNIHDKTIDLEDPFKYKFYYHRDLRGSSSIKAVGPHFAPNINYNDLNNIQKGDQSAAQAKKWLRLSSKEGDTEWLNIREDMLKYCEYDTLLMVAILQGLQEEILKYD